MCWHLEVLGTLLDESALESDRWAFLAATLLEALEEHVALGVTPHTAGPFRHSAVRRPGLEPPSLSSDRTMF